MYDIKYILIVLLQNEGLYSCRKKGDFMNLILIYSVIRMESVNSYL